MVLEIFLQNYTSNAVEDGRRDLPPCPTALGAPRKNFELQSCRFRRKLQFSYKVYLHSSSNKKITNF
jgi:hypothetical protein